MCWREPMELAVVEDGRTVVRVDRVLTARTPPEQRPVRRFVAEQKAAQTREEGHWQAHRLTSTGATPIASAIIAAVARSHLCCTLPSLFGRSPSDRFTLLPS